MIVKEVTPELQAHADAAHDRIEARSGSLLAFLREQAAPAVMKAPLPHRTKYIRLREITDKAAALVAPDTPCKPGCSACCYQAVPVLLTEAKIMAAATGRTVDRSKQIHACEELEVLAERLTAATTRYAMTPSPCPFLVDDRCSVYEVRPLACREHHVLHPDASRCKIAPERLNVRSVKFDLQWVTSGLFELSMSPIEYVADVREWFS